MVAGEPVGVLDNTLFANVYKDGLTTHSTDVVREVLGWHPGRAVILRKANKQVTLKTEMQRDAKSRQEFAYPNSRSHEISTHLCKVSTQDSVVQPIKEQRHTKVHRILWLYPGAITEPRLSWASTSASI